MKNYAYRILILIDTQRDFLRAIEKNIISLKDYKLFNKYISQDRWYILCSPEIVYKDIKTSTHLNYAFDWTLKSEYSSNKFFKLHTKIKEQLYNN